MITTTNSFSTAWPPEVESPAEETERVMFPYQVAAIQPQTMSANFPTEIRQGTDTDTIGLKLDLNVSEMR